MQTGYDNYWMYQNSRHEPIQSLSKNDNCIYPVLPDNYKQMQNGGSPSNRFVTHSNNVASSQNFQFSSGPQCLWPSSVYSLPFNSSQANNFHSQGYPAQCNNFSYSHHPQPKAGLRSSDVSVFQKNKGNNLKQFTPTLPQNSNYTNTETARIRVKDVYTLNNNSIYNAASNSNLVETQNNKQYEYPLNYTANNCNRTSDFEAAPNHLPPPYTPREQQCLTNQQQFRHYTAPLYLQHAQVLAGSHAQSNVNKQRDDNVQSKGSTKKPSLILELLRSNKNQEESQSRQFNTQDGNERVLGELKTKNQFSPKTAGSHISSERTNDTAYHDSSQVGEKLTCDNIHTNDCGFVPNQSHNQAQADFLGVNEVPLTRFSSIEDSRRKQMSEKIGNSNTRSFSNSSENNLVKITIPHTGQSTYIKAVDPSSRDRINNLSLPTLLGSSEEIFHDKSNKKNAQNYTQNGSHGFSLSVNNQVRQESCIVSPGRNHVYCTPPRSNPNDCNFSTGNSNRAYYSSIMTSPRNQVSSAQRFQKEPYDDPRQQDSEKTFPNADNIDSADGRQNNELIENSHEGESIFYNETALDNLTIKQENFASKADNLGIHVDFTVDDALPKIKTEQNTENPDLRQERESSENTQPEEESESSNSHSIDSSSTVVADEDRESFVASKNIISESERWKNAENRSSVSEIPEKETLEKDKTEENIAAQEAKFEKLKNTHREKNYKSKINRDKLDLLIKFLKKDDEVIEIKKSEENTSGDDRIREENKNEREAGFPRSRRKLCKTEIVKNKNNSREMVSLMSHKTSRTENQDSPKATKTEKKVSTEERESFCEDDKKENEIPMGVSDKETQKASDSKPETELKSVGSEVEESLVDEENIVNIMQALQNLKSHFCLSCTLVSPIDSFWINVVTGELRCSNCFKKITLKNDGNMLKSRRATDDDKNTEFKPFASDKVQKENETKKSEIYEEISKEPKENMNQETARFVCESTNNKSSYRNSEERRKADSPKVKVHYDKKEKKPSSSPPGKSISKEQYVSRKSPSSKEDLKQEKSNISVRGNSFEEEERGAEGKKDKKHYRDSSHNRKRANSKEEHGVHKVRVSEDELINVNSTSGESSDSCKFQPAEVIFKRNTSESDKSKTHGCSKEGCGDHKTKHIRSKHSNSLDDSDRKNMSLCKSLSKVKSLDAEDLIRKRRKSMDEIIPQKIRNLGGRSEEVKLAKQHSEKSKTTSFSKAEDSELKTKTSEHSKNSVFDFIHAPRKKYKEGDFSTSKEQSKTVTESSDKTRRSSTSKENLSSPEHSKKETKHEGLTSRSKDREKKSFVGKIPKISHKSSGKDSCEVNKTPSNDGKHQKSKPLKESQRIESEPKISSPAQMLKKSALLEYRHKSKERYDVRTEERKKNNEKNTKIGSSCITRHSEQEQKCDKSQTMRHSKKERALECIFGRRKEDINTSEVRKMSGETPPSAKLLEKLIEKTKKLSRSFLAES